MLTRIQIRGYKSLNDVDLMLSDLSLLFGPNAAGKSNFLDALQLLSKLASSKTIKRWLLVDSTAFKRVFGRGCDAPDLKCERARYKKALIESILKSGITPTLGGIEFSEDIVNAMELDRAGRSDASLRRLIEELRSVFKEWQCSTGPS